MGAWLLQPHKEGAGALLLLIDSWAEWAVTQLLRKVGEGSLLLLLLLLHMLVVEALSEQRDS